MAAETKLLSDDLREFADMADRTDMSAESILRAIRGFAEDPRSAFSFAGYQRKTFRHDWVETPTPEKWASLGIEVRRYYVIDGANNGR